MKQIENLGEVQNDKADYTSISGMEPSTLKKFASFPQKAFVSAGLLMALAGRAYADEPYNMENNAIKHFHLGQAWMEFERYDAAIQEFQLGIQLKPNATLTASIYNNMGMAFIQLNDLARAIISFQQAIHLNPQFSLYYENLAKAYSQAGSLEDAISQMQSDLAANPDDHQGWFLLGTLQQSAGYNNEAKRSFETYLKIAPYTLLSQAARHNLGLKPGDIK